MFAGKTVANLTWDNVSGWQPRPLLVLADVVLREKMLDDVLLSLQTGAGELDSNHFSGLLGARLRVSPAHLFDRRGSRTTNTLTLWFF